MRGLTNRGLLVGVERTHVLSARLPSPASHPGNQENDAEPAQKAVLLEVL